MEEGVASNNVAKEEGANQASPRRTHSMALLTECNNLKFDLPMQKSQADLTLVRSLSASNVSHARVDEALSSQRSYGDGLELGGSLSELLSNDEGDGGGQQPKQRRRSRASKLDFSEVTDITSFMHVLRLHKYTAGLVKHRIDLHSLLHLRDDDLETAGVTAQGARARLLVAIDKFRRSSFCNPAWLTPPANMPLRATATQPPVASPLVRQQSAKKGTGAAYAQPIGTAYVTSTSQAAASAAAINARAALTASAVLHHVSSQSHPQQPQRRTHFYTAPSAWSQPSRPAPTTMAPQQAPPVLRVMAEKAELTRSARIMDQAKPSRLDTKRTADALVDRVRRLNMDASEEDAQEQRLIETRMQLEGERLLGLLDHGDAPASSRLNRSTSTQIHHATGPSPADRVPPPRQYPPYGSASTLDVGYPGARESPQGSISMPGGTVRPEPAPREGTALYLLKESGIFPPFFNPLEAAPAPVHASASMPTIPRHTPGSMDSMWGMTEQFSSIGASVSPAGPGLYTPPSAGLPGR